MSNKQTLPNTKLDGALLRKKLISQPLSDDMVNIYDDEGSLGVFSDTLDLAKNMLNQKRQVEYENSRVKADALLQTYREQLGQASSEEDFDNIAKLAEDDLKNQMENSGFWSREFWDKNGNNIIEANKKDIAKLRSIKEQEFGRNSLNLFLDNNQNMMSKASSEKANLLLDSGINEIEQSLFLDDEDKKVYKDKFIKSGLLNLALNNPDEALNKLSLYSIDNKDDLITKINQTKQLRDEAIKKYEEKQTRQRDINAFNRAFGLWQAKESGAISDAEFFVLNADDKENLLWGMNEKRSSMPLVDAYKIVKKANAGENLSVDDIKNVGNYLIGAYQNKDIGVNKASFIQNQLVVSNEGDEVNELLFDKNVDDLLDNVLMEDAYEDNELNNIFMNEKAKLAFDLYESYYGKKLALTDEFRNMGGVVTPAIERKFGMQALSEVKDEFLLKESDSDMLSFSELNSGLDDVINLGAKKEIWKKFFAKAPFVEDKKKLFNSIASNVRKRELKYPYFDSVNEVKKKNLAKGDKFYFNGRMAMKI
ncbi:MAG: hypothetical protein IJE43_09760 [Alphaproteobacteria bacterium]|nr:hypothetical protein [Alphaproteobacteria bacterium]